MEEISSFQTPKLRGTLETHFMVFVCLFGKILKSRWGEMVRLLNREYLSCWVSFLLSWIVGSSYAHRQEVLFWIKSFSPDTMNLFLIILSYLEIAVSQSCVWAHTHTWTHTHTHTPVSPIVFSQFEDLCYLPYFFSFNLVFFECFHPFVFLKITMTLTSSIIAPNLSSPKNKNQHSGKICWKAKTNTTGSWFMEIYGQRD